MTTPVALVSAQRPPATRGLRRIIERLDDAMLLVVILAFIPVVILLIGAPIALVAWLISFVGGR